MKNRFLSIVFVILCIPLIILFNKSNASIAFRSNIINTLKPVLEFSHFFFLNFTEGLYRLTEYASVMREKETLARENDFLRESVIDMHELKEENQRLKHLLNFQAEINTKHISSQIIGRDVSVMSNTIILNIGSESGAMKNMPIIAPGGLVGKISSVGKNTSRAVLIIERKSKVSVLIQRTRDTAIVEGLGESLLRMQYINLKSDITLGDIIITSGMGGIFPKGIPVGTIVLVGKERDGLHLFAQVKPFVDFTKLEEVVCLER